MTDRDEIHYGVGGYIITIAYKTNWNPNEDTVQYESIKVPYAWKPVFQNDLPENARGIITYLLRTYCSNDIGQRISEDIFIQEYARAANNEFIFDNEPF